MDTKARHGSQAEEAHEWYAGLIRRATEARATLTELDTLTRSCGCDLWAYPKDPNRIDAAL